MLTITLADAGFKTMSQDGVWACVLWEEVWEIFAFKRDLFGVDLICLGFQLNAAGDFFEVDEECDGYKELVAEVERRFDVTQGWWAKVEFPAFEANLTTLWSRLS